MEWISVKNELPKKMEYVLLYDSKYHVTHIGARVDNGYYISLTMDQSRINITHWMPLPEPPKEDECR